MKLRTLILILTFIFINTTNIPENLWSGKSKKFPEKLIKTILGLHNSYRSQIAVGTFDNGNGVFPVASNMKQLYWSDKLARKAQLWANNGENKKSAEQYRALAGTTVGENIALKVHAGEVKPELMAWEEVIKNWFKENKYFEVKNIYPFEPQPKAMSFSQIIWAKTEFIGCGYSAFKSKSGDSQQLYVCHYSPGGNELVKEVYNEGELCKKCEEGYSCQSDYLIT